MIDGNDVEEYELQDREAEALEDQPPQALSDHDKATAAAFMKAVRKENSHADQ